MFCSPPQAHAYSYRRAYWRCSHVFDLKCRVTSMFICICLRHGIDLSNELKTCSVESFVFHRVATLMHKEKETMNALL